MPRTKLKDLPQTVEELTTDEASQVKGGGITQDVTVNKAKTADKIADPTAVNKAKFADKAANAVDAYIRG